MRRKQSKNTREDFIRADEIEGYLVDNSGKIIGEARGYDPYSRLGEVMFYEMDMFGFVTGYIHDNWTVMSKTDIANDRNLLKQLERTEYKNWKRHNIVELTERWDNICKKYGDFEEFCKGRYKISTK